MLKVKHTNDAGQFKPERMLIYENDELIADIIQPNFLPNSTDFIRIWNKVYRIEKVVVPVTENKDNEYVTDVYVVKSEE